MRIPWQILALAATAVLTISAAAQPIQYASQERTTSVMLNVPQCAESDHDSESAPDFLDFDSSVGAGADCAAATAIVGAEQISSLSTNSIFASGGAAYNASATVTGVIIAVGSSSLDVTFELPADKQFRLIGQIEAQSTADIPGAVAGVTVRLSSPQRGVILEETVSGDSGGPVDLSGHRGVLPAGTYRVQISASSILDYTLPPAVSASGDFDAAFWFTCPGDVQHDYDVDIADLAQLLSRFGLTQGATPEDGDVDGDGDVDLSDLSLLLANFGSTDC